MQERRRVDIRGDAILGIDAYKAGLGENDGGVWAIGRIEFRETGLSMGGDFRCRCRLCSI
jgi:hypothetical protein